MPFQSKAQNAWAHTAEGTKALGGKAAVKEWEGATNYDHLPERKGYAKGGIVKDDHGIYATGGPARGGDTRWTKKDPQARGKYGQFLGTKDRFTDGRKTAGYPEAAKTDEDWSKSKGVGHTDDDDCGDTKRLKPVLPRK
jgi:hypothetical protein